MSYNFETLFFEDFFNSKWAWDGDTRTVTWSTVSNTLILPASGQRVPVVQASAPYIATFQQAFDLWDAALDSLTFVYTTEGNNADVTLAITDFDGVGGTAAFFNTFGRIRPEGGSTTNRATIQFDSNDLPRVDVLTIAMHEIGNILGLGDLPTNSPIQSVQREALPETFRGDALWSEDYNMIRFHYGEPIGTSSQTVTNPNTSDTRVLTDKNDRFVLGAGSERVDGGTGIDEVRAIMSDRNATIEITGPASLTLTDRSGSGGIDFLDNFETLAFNNRDLDLAQFRDILSLSDEEFRDLAEMYAAYFNRAPDAIGLYFWADQLADGMSMNRIAEFFFDQPETRALYGEVLETDAFVGAIYQNVLGRSPDAAGFQFWVDNLESGAVSRGAFVLEIINGARAATGSPLDAQYLAEKAQLGIHFSAGRGMSDVDDAIQVMQVFGLQAESNFEAAVAAIEAHHADASMATSGDLLISLVGVSDILE